MKHEKCFKNKCLHKFATDAVIIKQLKNSNRILKKCEVIISNIHFMVAAFHREYFVAEHVQFPNQQY